SALQVGARQIAIGSGIAARQCRSSATPDTISHMSIRAVRDAGLAEIADVIQILFDLLIAAGEVERDLRHIVEAAARTDTAADVINLESGRLPLVALLDEALGRRSLGRCRETYPGDPKLLEIRHVLRRGGPGTGADLDSRRNRRQFGLRRRR